MGGCSGPKQGTLSVRSLSLTEALGNLRFGVRDEVDPVLPHRRDHPRPLGAAQHAMGVRAHFLGERLHLATQLHQPRSALPWPCEGAHVARASRAWLGGNGRGNDLTGHASLA